MTLRTETEAECSSWKQKLEEATHKHFVPTDQNDNTETISGTEFICDILELISMDLMLSDDFNLK